MQSKSILVAICKPIFSHLYMSLYHLFNHFVANWDKYGVVYFMLKEIRAIERLIKIIKPIYNFLYNAMNVEATYEWVIGSAKWLGGKMSGLFKKH